MQRYDPRMAVSATGARPKPPAAGSKPIAKPPGQNLPVQPNPLVNSFQRDQSGRKPPGQHIAPINRPKPGNPVSNSELAADSVMPAKPGLIDMAKGNMTTSGTIVGGDNPIAPLSGAPPSVNNLRPNQQYDGGMGPAVATGGGGGGAYQPIYPPAENTGPSTNVPAPVEQPAQIQPQQSGGFSYDYTGRANAIGGQSANAVMQTVDPNQTMSYQLNNILDRDSDFMRRAAQFGIDRSSSRGLGNSSIAAGNAMGSMIDRAMPIAGFDASRYGRVGDLNQGEANAMANNNATRALQASMFNQEQMLAWNNAGRADRALDSQMYAGMFGNYFQALSGIYSNPNLTGEQQNAAAQNLGDMFPGFANQAWSAIPQNLLAGNAVPAAQMLPPMQNMPAFPGFPPPP